MSDDINKVALSGRLADDPKEHVFTNGGKVVNVSVATNRFWKSDGETEWAKATEFHSVSIISRQFADFAMKSCKRGDHVSLEGRLEYRSWTDTNGSKQVRASIVVHPKGNFQIFNPNATP